MPHVLAVVPWPNIGSPEDSSLLVCSLKHTTGPLNFWNHHVGGSGPRCVAKCFFVHSSGFGNFEPSMIGAVSPVIVHRPNTHPPNSVFTPPLFPQPPQTLYSPNFFKPNTTQHSPATSSTGIRPSDLPHVLAVLPGTNIGRPETLLPCRAH